MKLLKEIKLNFSSFSKSDTALQKELLYLEKMCDSRIHDIKNKKIAVNKKQKRLFFKDKSKIPTIDKRGEDIQIKFYKILVAKIRNLRNDIVDNERVKANLPINEVRSVPGGNIKDLTPPLDIEECDTLELDTEPRSW